MITIDHKNAQTKTNDHKGLKVPTNAHKITQSMKALPGKVPGDIIGQNRALALLINR